MKKVALLLLIISGVVLILACKGVLKDTVPLQASPPDMLPLFVITHANCPGIPQCSTPSNTTTISFEAEQLQAEKLNDAMITIFKMYRNRQ